MEDNYIFVTVKKENNNKRNRRLIIAFLLMLQSVLTFLPHIKIESAKAAYTSYYVSTTGNDANDGSAPDDAHAWKTVDHAWDQLREGDRLYILAGTYTEEILEYNQNIHGNETHPIIIEPYQNDYVVLRQITDDSNKGIITIFNQHHFVFKDLHFNDSACFGVFLTWNSGVSANNITFINCSFDNCSSSAIKAAGAGSHVRDVNVWDCFITDCQNYWKTEHTQEVISIANSSYWQVNDSYFANNPKWCIDVKSGSHHVNITDNFFNTTHSCGHLPADPGVGNTNRQQRGGGCYVDGYAAFCHNVTISENYYEGNHTAVQLAIEEKEGDWLRDIDIFNNIMNMHYNDPNNSFGCFVTMVKGGEENGSQRLERINFTQNTMTKGYYGILIQHYGDCLVDFNISNNIFDRHINGFERSYTNATPDVWNNLYNASYIDIYGENAVNGSPHFIDEDSNWQLKSTSFAIDMGIDTGITTDYIGTTRPINDYYDVGAYEYPVADKKPRVETRTHLPWVGLTTATLRGRLLNSYETSTTAGFQIGTTKSYGTTIPVVYNNLSGINCHKDCYTSYSNPNVNYPADDGDVYALFDNTYFENAPTFINFSGLDGYFGSTITKAELGLYITDSYSDSRITIEPTNEYWSENSVTYNNQPDTIGNDMINSQLMNSGWNYFDITSFIQDCLDGTETWSGLCVYDDDYNGGSPPDYSDWSFVYDGKEGDHPPVLRIWQDEPIDYSYYITSLAYGTLYHYRAYGTNSYGTGTGIDRYLLTKPYYILNFRNTVNGNGTLLLEWGKLAHVNNTVIRRSTTAYPENITEGTEVYNGSGTSYLDTVDNATTYYYTAWPLSMWNVSGDWLFEYGFQKRYTTAITTPQKPQNVSSSIYTNGVTYSINITWDTGTGADKTVIRKSTGEPPANPQSGIAVYNGSLEYYNDTGLTQAYSYRIWSYNVSSGLFSDYVDINWSIIWIECFDENTSAAIADYSVFFSNPEGTETYEQHNCNNPHLVNVSDIPTGNDILMRVNKTGYSPRSYYFDIEPYGVEYIVCYLSELNATNIYYFSVTDYYGIPIEDATINIKKQIDGEFKSIAIIRTDSSGKASQALQPNQLYKAVISKTGYVTKTSEFETDPVYYGYYYPIEFRLNLYDVEEETIFSRMNWSIEPEIFDHYQNFTVYFNISSDDNALQWYAAAFYFYNNITETWDLLADYNLTDAGGGFINFTTESGIGRYGLTCRFKKEGFDQHKFNDGSKYVYTLWPESGAGNPDLEEMIRNTVGSSPVNVGETVVSYGALIAAVVSVFGFFTFSPRLAGIGVMIVGIVLGAFKEPLGIISDDVLNYMVVAVIVILGFILLITLKKERKQ